MDSVLLKAQELSYSYHTLNGETPALDRVSFCLYRKEFLAIVGPSGCGKSTILSLIAGLLTPDSGGITFYGENGHQPVVGEHPANAFQVPGCILVGDFQSERNILPDVSPFK